MTTFLFTTLPTNDLGLLTRSLPIARELAEQGHTILFCSPANAPSRLIAEAGFHNLLPRHPIYDLMRGDQSRKGLFVSSPRANGGSALTTSSVSSASSSQPYPSSRRPTP